ncbi:MAG: hypothetical protein LBR13_02315 [Dysgonamonadaceae bacterium]|jgi:DNA-binding CsgD family transcriptional regulator|nr:hypothetical protein [Dysgonamonadaceae bacterium]
MRKYLKTYLFVYLIVILQNDVVFSQTKNFVSATPGIINYFVGDYLAARQNWSVTQDEKGIMYFANGEGLLEFDGKRWIKHTAKGVEDLRAVAFEPKTKRIYSGTFEEFGYWERDSQNKLEYFSVSNNHETNTMHNDEIWSIHFFGDTVIYRAFSRYYIYFDDKIEVKPFPSLCFTVQAINNTVYAATTTGFYELYNGVFHPVRGGSEFRGNKEIVAILKFNNSQALCATRNSGIYLYDGDNFTKWVTEYDRQLSEYHINRAISIEDSVYIFGTILDGLIALDNKGKLLWTADKNDGLQNNTVLGLFKDREGNIWTALDAGIDMLETNSALRFYQGANDNVEAVYAIKEFNGNIYLATNKGLFCRAKNSGKFALLSTTEGQVWDLYESDGELLCGHNNGTSRISGANVVPISTVTGGYCIRNIKSGNKEFLIQSTYTKLVLYHKTGSGWSFLRSIPKFIEPLRYLEIDSRGYIWAAHNKKDLFRIRLNDEMTAIEDMREYDKVGKYEAIKPGVFKIDNRIVFTTGNLLFTYDDINDTIIPYEKLNRELGNLAKAHKIIETGKNRYWFACTDRLTCVEIKNDRCNVTTNIMLNELKNKVMQKDECVFTDDNDVSYIGLNNGFAMIDKQNAKIRDKEMPIIFLRTAEVSNSERTASFEYAFPSYSTAGSRLFYKLEGLEPHWIPTPGDLRTSYSRLPSGKYVFKVIALHEDGSLIADTSFDFRIFPPWYAGEIAVICYFILGIILLFAAYKIGKVRLEKKHRKILFIEEKRRQEELEQKEQKIIRLKNEKLEAEILFKGKELAVSAMAIIQKNNVLQTLKQELQKIEKDKNVKNIIKLINKNLASEKDWEVFEANFDLIHERFFRNLKKRTPQLTPNDLKLCAYLRLNLSTKEIAQLTGNSVRGVEVARYRLRKKLQLSTEQNLNEFMLEFKGE